MIETEKRSECWFSSTQKWHKTIPFLLLLLFFSFFILFDVLFEVMTLSLSLHLHLTHTLAFHVISCLHSTVSFIIYTCQLHSLMHISRGQFHSEEIVLWVCVCAFFIFLDFYWHLNCILFCCWHTLHSRTIFILTFLFSLRKVNSKQTNHIGMFMEINDQTIQKALWQTWIFFESFSLRGM